MTPQHTPQELDEFWQFTWEAMARQGYCDAWGSAEQVRVTEEWIAAGRPEPVPEFIIARANKPA